MKREKEEDEECWNKAGYTANTSCGRVGRGTLFDSCSRTDQRTDRPTDGRTDGRTDKASYRVACPQLKTKIPVVE